MLKICFDQTAQSCIFIKSAVKNESEDGKYINSVRKLFENYMYCASITRTMHIQINFHIFFNSQL